MNTKISIIIVHWNTPQILKSQLTALSFHEGQIIVIDNQSNESLSWIKKEFPKVEVLKNKINRGYSFAGNQGASLATGEWLIFLNPDVEISKNSLQQLYLYAEKNNVDACCPQMDDNYNKPLPTPLSLLIEFSPLKKFIPQNIFNLKTLFGGCLLIKKKVFMEIGGWDERFFLWFEDSDLTKRLIDKKCLLAIAPIKINHAGGSSFQKLTDQFKKDVFFNSMEIYAKKHFFRWGQIMVKLIKNRFTQRKLLPLINPSTSITVPNLRIDLLKDFLLKNRNCLSEIDDLIIVTSAVSPDKIGSWRSDFPNIRFIPINQNNGFASTVNIGFRVSTGEWIGTVNDDVVLTRDWIKNCLLCKKENAGSINPVIYNSDEKVESAGIDILLKGKASPIKNINEEIDYSNVEATNGAAVLYSKEALNKVGLFDERFGSYLEDIDLSLRLKRAGYQNIVSTKSKVYHHGQSSIYFIGLKKYLFDLRNWIYVIAKNWSLKDLILNAPLIFLERLRNLSGLLKNVI